MKNSDPFTVTSAILFITVQRQNKKTTNPFKPSIQKWTDKCIHETVQSNQQDLYISWWKCEWCFPREKKKSVHNGAATCSEWFSVGCYSVAKVFREDF